MNTALTLALFIGVVAAGAGLLLASLPLWLAASLWIGGAAFTVLVLSVWAELDAMEDRDA